MAKVKANGMLASEILAKTTPRTKGGARFVTVASATPKLVKGGFAALVCKTYSTHDLDGNPKQTVPKRYQTTVYATEPNVRLHKARLKVACSCDNHVFAGGEYALWLKGAADIKYGNGEPPTTTNPSLIPWACKHICRVLAQVIKQRV